MTWQAPMYGATVLVLMVALPTTAHLQEASAITTPLVFDRVTVVDVAQGRLLPAQRVVIVGTRIQVVGSAQDVAAPAGAQVVDAQGKYLIPGLWDMHIHPGDASEPMRGEFVLPLLLANGVTGIRDATSAGLADQIRLQREILAGTRVGPPRQLFAGGHLTDNGANAASLKAQGATFLKVYPMTFANARMARVTGLPFGGHVEDPGEKGGISAMDASDSGIRIIDHVNTGGGLDKACWGTRATVEQCQPIVERFRRNGTWFAPTIVPYYALIPPERAATGIAMSQAPHARAVARQFARRTREFLDGALLHGNWLQDSTIQSRGRAADDTTRKDGVGTFAMAMIQRLDLPVLTGTDDLWTWGMGMADFRSFLPGFSLHTELAMFVAEGMTPARTLQAATLNPAKLLGATDSMGTVAAGKLADLVLLDGNPLEDITNTTAIRAVVANGRYYDRAALDQVLRAAQAIVRHRGLPIMGIP